MFDRLPTGPTPFLLLSLSLAACSGSEGSTGPSGPTGPTGPAGEAGPGTRIVLSGTINVAEAPDTVLLQIGQALPPEAGTLADPPSVTCWLSGNGLAWFQELCIIIPSEDQTQLIAVIFGLNGELYRIIVVY